MNPEMTSYTSPRLLFRAVALILALGMVGCSESETRAVSVVPSVPKLL